VTNPSPTIDELRRFRRLGRKTKALYVQLDAQATVQTEGIKLSCKAGCAHCCHLLLLVTLPEAIAIAEYFLADSQRRTLIPTLSRQFFEQVQKIPLGVSEDIRTEYFKSKTPCAFLDTTSNLCSVYEVRPTACRYHWVISDPDLCSPDKTSQVQKLDTLTTDVRALQEALKSSKQAKLPLFIAPLPVMMLWAFKLLVEGRSAFDRDLNSPAQELGSLNLLGWRELLEREVGRAET
jgi:Fe-S-cluster containining protein